MDQQKIKKYSLPNIDNKKSKDTPLSNSSEYRVAFNKKAFAQLKSMNQSIEMMNNRLKILSFKQKQIQKMAQLQKNKEKAIKWDILRTKSDQQISNMLAQNHLKQQILLIQKKQSYRDRIKKNKEMIIKALKEKSEEKQRKYKQIKQKSLENRSKIHINLRQLNSIKKNMHDTIVKQQTQIQKKINTLKAIKSQKIKKVCQLQINPIVSLIAQSEAKFNQLREKCEKMDLKIKRSESNQIKRRKNIISRFITEAIEQKIQNPETLPYKKKKKSIESSYKKSNDLNELTKESSMYEFIIIK